MKVCPLLLVHTFAPGHGTPDEIMCIEERCAWWINGGEYQACAITLLSLVAHDFLILKFPLIASHRHQPWGTVHGEKSQ